MTGFKLRKAITGLYEGDGQGETNQRRQVTALFTDLTGFTRPSNELGAEPLLRDGGRHHRRLRRDNRQAYRRQRDGGLGPPGDHLCADSFEHVGSRGPP